MEKSVFEVPKMDCAADEGLVRMKLEEFDTVQGVQVDIAERRVTVFHEGQLDDIQTGISELNLGSRLLETEQTDTGELALEDTQHVDRNLLWIVLLINFVFFVGEMTAGFLFSSMALVADSLDMLADALVYGLSLFVVGGTLARKKNVAKWSGYLQLTLAVIGFFEVMRRFFGFEELPDFRAMIIVAFLALLANSVALYLLQRSKSQEAHMKASMIFTSNDIIINFGVIAAGLLVSWFNSSIPDLVVGAIVFLVVTRGAFRILKVAK